MCWKKFCISCYKSIEKNNTTNKKKYIYNKILFNLYVCFRRSVQTSSVWSSRGIALSCTSVGPEPTIQSVPLLTVDTSLRSASRMEQTMKNFVEQFFYSDKVTVIYPLFYSYLFWPWVLSQVFDCVLCTVSLWSGLPPPQASLYLQMSQIRGRTSRAAESSAVHETLGIKVSCFFMQTLLSEVTCFFLFPFPFPSTNGFILHNSRGGNGKGLSGIFCPD